MKNKYGSKKILKTLIDILWFGALSAAILIILIVISYNLSVFGLINIRLPVVSIEMNNYTYRFNSQFAEVRRIDSITKEAVEIGVAQILYHASPQTIKVIEQLYMLDFSKMPVDYRGSEALRYGRFTLYPEFLMPIRYFAHEDNPEPIMGLSSFFLIVSAFLLIILYNLRELFRSALTGNGFSKENSERLKFIGVYLLLGEIVRLLIFYWINNSVARTEWVNSIRQSYNFSFSDVNFALLFAGMVFLILASIFRMSAAIKEENDLTV
ncbi:MAG: DUF2975 domain-containing protein [Melioribacteraceae bacterium]|nr:DUF2975 domain-containing protein [Melioribacteraceae bacterium]